MNIRNVIERLRKIYNSDSEDFTKCELMENILRAYQRSIEDRIMRKFHNGFFDISIHTTRSIIRHHGSHAGFLNLGLWQALIDPPLKAPINPLK